MQKKNIGGIMSGIRKRLRASGVSEEVIIKAFARPVLRQKEFVWTDLAKTKSNNFLMRDGKCILSVPKYGNKIRVNSFSGYVTKIGQIKGMNKKRVAHAFVSSGKHIAEALTEHERQAAAEYYGR